MKLLSLITYESILDLIHGKVKGEQIILRLSINILFFFLRTYYWYDEKGKKTKCTAPQYVDFVMSSVQKLVTDEDIFPTKYGESLFPPSGRICELQK